MQRSRLRGLIRRLRETRGVGAVVRSADRIWWFRVIQRSGLVDAEYYSAQLRLRVPAAVAVAHYVVRGFRRGMSVNPLFDDIVAGWELPEVLRVPALYAYLVNERETVTIHPWWDAVAFGAERGAPGLEAAWADHELPIELTAAGNRQTMSVAELRRRAIAAARRWRRKGETGDVPPGGDVGLVRMVQAHDRRYTRKLVQAALRADSMRVLVPLVGVDASQWVSAILLCDLVPGVVIRQHAPRSRWRSVVVDAARDVTTRVLVFLDPRAEYDEDQLESLAAGASGAVAVCAAHRAADGTVAGVGAADVGGRHPYPLLLGHAGDDLAGLPDAVDVPLLHGRTFAMARSYLLRGLAAVEAREPDVLAAVSRVIRDEVSLRSLARVDPVLDEPTYAFGDRDARHRVRDRSSPAGWVTIDRTAAERVLGGAGFRVRHWSTDARGEVGPALAWVPPHAGARRWAVKMCAPAGRQGAVWGDAHFARGLAAALRRRGHTVVIDAYDARDRPSASLDDVSIVIRGPYTFSAPQTPVTIEWIISHPDSITREEITQFDRVFAASPGWAQRAGERWDVDVDALLPCTDTDVFAPRGLERDDDVVFVGKTRGAPRRSVIEPVRAGIPVRVYGPDWAHFVPASSIAAKSIPHERLAERYETASIVLNDQWPDMQREGFMTLRPFDVVAVAGRLISEPVEGMAELFGGAVVTYRDTAHLVEMLRQAPDGLFPSEERLSEIAASVRAEHSFDARAAVLDAAAEDVLAGRR